MKRTVSGVVLILLLVMGTSILASLIQPVKTETTAVVSVSPEFLQVGEESQPLPKSFCINVTVTDVADLYAWQIQIYHSPRILDFTDAISPAGHVFNGEFFVECVWNETLTKTLANETVIDFSNPMGTMWLGIVEEPYAPKVPRDYNITAWFDKDKSGTLTVSDIVFLNPKLPPMIEYFYIDRIAWEGSAITLDISIAYTYYAMSLIGEEPTFSGSGIFCQIVYDAIRPEVAFLNFSAARTILLNSSMVDITHKLEGGIVKVFGDTTPMIGDLNGDGKIDIQDIALASISFGSYPDHPRWNRIADINQDDKVDIRDLLVIAIHFGEVYP